MDISCEKCLIQFGDDTERWSLFRDLKKVRIQEDSDIPCIICKSMQSSPTNEILLCHYCRRGYHQICHEVVLEQFDALQYFMHKSENSAQPNVLKKSNGDAHWMCSRCLGKRQAREKEKLLNCKPVDAVVNNNYNKILNKTSGPYKTLPYNVSY